MNLDKIAVWPSDIDTYYPGCPEWGALMLQLDWEAAHLCNERRHIGPQHDPTLVVCELPKGHFPKTQHQMTEPFGPRNSDEGSREEDPYVYKWGNHLGTYRSRMRNE